MLELSYHSLILLVGFAIAGLALFAAIAVGPYGRRGVRVTLALIAFVAFAGSAGWLMVYLGLIDQRRAIETRFSELRAQALGSGPLACLERTGDLVEGACAQTLFASPETLAAASAYTSARLDVLKAAARYAGPRNESFNDVVRSLRRSLQSDPFGLTANVLMRRENCTAERCDVIGLFANPARVWENIRQNSFDANVARHAASWRAPGAPAAPATASAPPTPPAGEGTRAPIPDKYTLPSSASIPPVSIMDNEPARAPAPPPAKDRPADRPAASAPAVAATPPAEQPKAAPPEGGQPSPPRPAASQKQRRETARPSAPMSITPPKQ